MVRERGLRLAQQWIQPIGLGDGMLHWRLTPVPHGSLEWGEAVLQRTKSGKDVVPVKQLVNLHGVWSHLHVMMQLAGEFIARVG